jgi:hypothetical protein
MLPLERIITQHYREKNFTVYSSLIQTLKQAEKNHELTVWNSNQRPLGTAPLPEVHANAKKNSPKGNIQTENSSSKGKRKRAKKPRGNVPKGKGISKPKNVRKIATKSPALGVVATTILLRNAGLLNIWLNYT